MPTLHNWGTHSPLQSGACDDWRPCALSNCPLLHTSNFWHQEGHLPATGPVAQGLGQREGCLASGSSQHVLQDWQKVDTLEVTSTPPEKNTDSCQSTSRATTLGTAILDNRQAIHVLGGALWASSQVRVETSVETMGIQQFVARGIDNHQDLQGLCQTHTDYQLLCVGLFPRAFFVFTSNQQVIPMVCPSFPLPAQVSTSFQRGGVYKHRFL